MMREKKMERKRERELRNGNYALIFLHPIMVNILFSHSVQTSRYRIAQYCNEVAEMFWTLDVLELNRVLCAL